MEGGKVVKKSAPTGRQERLGGKGERPAYSKRFNSPSKTRNEKRSRIGIWRRQLKNPGEVVCQADKSRLLIDGRNHRETSSRPSEKAKKRG